MADAPPPPANASAPPGKIAGYVIGACALLTIVANGMLSMAGPHPAFEVFRAVHGTLIASMIALLYGFVVYSLRRGLRSDAVVAGLVAYGIGAGATIAAALIEGFIFPTLDFHYGGQIGMSISMLCASAIELLTEFGVVAISAAIALWSVELACGRGVTRAVAAIGFAAALVAVGALFGGATLFPHALTITAIAQGSWYLTIATLLVREKV
jgi:hypothetical protein